MRARLTASFVVLGVVLLIGALWVRGYTEYSLQRTHESRELRGQATTLALVIEQRMDLDRPVDRAFLAGVVDPSDRLQYDAADGTSIVVEGQDYDEDHADDAIQTSVDAAGGTLTVTQAGDVLARLDRPRQGLAGLPRAPRRVARGAGRLRDGPAAVASVPPARRRGRAARPRPVRPRPAPHPHPRGEGASARRCSPRPASSRSGSPRSRRSPSTPPTCCAPR